MTTLQLLWQCFALIAVAGQMASQPNREVSAALVDLNNGRVLESIQQLKNVLHSDPTNGPANFYLSTIYTEMKEYDLAERLVRRAMEVNSKQGPHYYQLGLIRYRQKQFRSALEFYHQALEMGSVNGAQVWRSIGDAQLELFDRDAAFQAYGEALRIQPQDARTHLALGRFYQEKGEPGPAIDHLLVAIKNDPQLHAAYPLLGRAYQQRGELGSAANILKQAVDADPSDQESRYTLGRVLIAMGRADEGREQLEKYDGIREQVAGAEGRYQTALSRIDEGKYSEAEMLLRETIRLAPKYGPALQSLGRLLADRGSPETALPILERAAEVNPLSADTWFGLATVYFQTGKQARALEAADRAVALNGDDERYQRLLKQIQDRALK
jgi:tetratricopeptide (TPR) repeat protein